MNINFATCEPKRALEFIRKVYSSYTITEEQCKEVLDLVAQDIIRIQDPMMHGSTIQVVVGNKFDASKHDVPTIQKTCQEMTNSITKGKKQ